MKMEVYTVSDLGVKAFLPPFYARARGEAIRSFTELVNRDGSLAGKYPAQFALLFLGMWDDENGAFECGLPETVISAVAVLEPIEGAVPAPRQVNGRIPM